MKARPERPALRSFLRGLVHTCLLLLLPCQLGLLWLARNDRPLRLPDRLIAKASASLRSEGVRFKARSLLLNPDRSLRAEDVSLGFDGAGDGVVTAERIDVRLGLAALLAGRLELTGIRVTGAKVVLPAPLASDGHARTLIERADCEAVREGSWAVLRGLTLRTREITAFAAGEAPFAAFIGVGADDAGLTVAESLRRAETWIRELETGGIRTVELRIRGDGKNGAAMSLTALASQPARPTQAPDVEAQDLRISLTAGFRPLRGISWTAEASARTLTVGRGSDEVRASGVTAYLSPVDGKGRLKLIAKAQEVRREGWPAGHLRLESAFEARLGRSDTWIRLSSAGSRLEGWVIGEGGAWRSAKIKSAHLSVEEALRMEPVARAAAESGGSLSGSVILRDVLVTAGKDGGLAKASGHVDLSGVNILGLSSAAIAPGKSLPLSAGFDFDPARGEKPLRLFDLALASVTGEAEVSLRSGGPFSLHLRGDLAPGCLNQVLGRWWTDLWSLFRVGRHPRAYIDVEGEWMKAGARTTGRVRLDDFAFMGAPFRGVEVTVDADAQKSVIGLEDLAGGNLPSHGSVDGKVTWDWSLPPESAGPHVDVSGDMEPWIAARCAGEPFSEALKGLRLPAGRRLRVTAKPEEGRPAVTAEISAPGVTEAWGFPLHELRARTSGAGEGMSVSASFGLAEGAARLDVRGDVLRNPTVDLSILGARPELLLGVIEGTKPEQKGKGRLDLDFKGTVDLKSPKMLRGLGHYRLADPELKRVRLLGGLSALLEELGVNATSYDLLEAKGSFGCLGGKAYFPDLSIRGPQSMLALSGVSDLEKGDLDFIGDFSLLDNGGTPLIGLFNPNRALINLSKIRVKGTFSNPSTSGIPRLSDIINMKNDNILGNIPDELKE